MYARRRREGPALHRSPVPALSVTVSAFVHAFVGGAVVLLAGFQWNTPKVYVVNLVPAVAAVGSPVGHRPAPTLPRRPVLSKARPLPESLPKTPAAISRSAPPVPTSVPKRSLPAPKPPAPPPDAVATPKLPDSAVPLSERPRPPARPPTRERPGELEPTLRLPERRLAARPPAPVRAAEAEPSLRLPERRATTQPALPRPRQKELPSLTHADKRAAVPTPPARKVPKREPSVEPPRAVAPIPLGRPEGSTTGVASLALDVSDFPFTYYLRQIQQKVSEKWVPPAQTAEPAQRVVVLFEIGRDGQVAAPQVEQSSGNSWYDQSAIRAVLDATPFPPLPQAFPAESLRVHFGFDFVQERS